jgi:hypothetical protein
MSQKLIAPSSHLIALAYRTPSTKPFLFSPGLGTLTAMSLPKSAAVALALYYLVGIGACASAGRVLTELFRERPPVALDSMSVASDVRIDSLGYLVGSFVGEGTSRSVHLLSSDTSLVAGLLRRYRPDLVDGRDIWASLRRENMVTLALGSRRRTVAGTPRIGQALVASPLGQNRMAPSAILLHGSSCGWRGTQVEIIANPLLKGGALRGPVLGSLTRTGTADSAGEEDEFRAREPVPAPGGALTEELLGRTTKVMDSVLATQAGSLSLRAPEDPRIEINTLADVDAADVIAYRTGPENVRYAVSLRARRVTAHADTVLAATVMAWDSAGAWKQTVFRPTLMALRRGRLAPYGAFRRSLFWRRLQPISDFAFDRDNLWMEQVDVRAGSVLWGIIQPKGNVVVAAAEMEAPCR